MRHEEGRDICPKFNNNPHAPSPSTALSLSPRLWLKLMAASKHSSTVDSGKGTERTQRFFTFTPLFQSADRAIAYAQQQAREWMKQKSLA